MNDKLKIFLVDDHQLFREGLKLLLSCNELISEIHEAENGTDYLNKLSEVDPDIVLMDIEMPVTNGIEATKRSLLVKPDIKIIALSMHANENFYYEMIDAGAKGFLLKNSKFEDVIKAIKDVNEGQNYFSPEILKAIVTNLNRKKHQPFNNYLSKRETEILYHICKGLSNQEIAEVLFISKRTVDKHRENILLKTHSKNTANLVIYAIKNKVIKI